MKNKYLQLLSIVPAGLLLQSGLFQTSATASPLVSIGDSTDVYFNGSTSLRSTSNVYRDEANETSDLIWMLSPGLEVNVGRGLSAADFSLITSYDIIRYQDEDRLDTELFHIKAVGAYNTSRLDLSGSVAFDEYKTSSGDTQLTNVQDLIEFDTLNANLDSEYRFSPKFSFGAGVSYSDTEYQTFDELFADRKTIRFPFDLFYELTPKVDLSAGYSYTNTDIDERSSSVLVSVLPLAFGTRVVSDYEQDSHFFNIGARGNLLPKLTGFFKVGYRTRSTDDSTISTFNNNGVLLSTGSTNRNEDGMLGLDANLTWAATPKLSTRLSLSRDFGVGGEGQSTENTSFDINNSYSMNEYFAASLNLGYTLRDYSNDVREDKQYDAGLRLSYTPNRYWSFSTGYTYSENDSNAADLSYDNHMLDLTASLRY